VLIGMMGSGKSAIGLRLAARLGLKFIDADAEIVAAACMSIPEIFAKYGEGYFRDGERRVMFRLLNSGPAVLATGGGAFLDSRTRQRIAERGVSIWFDADHETCSSGCAARPTAPFADRRSGGDPAPPDGRTLSRLRLADIRVVSRDTPQMRCRRNLDALAERLPTSLRARRSTKEAQTIMTHFAPRPHQSSDAPPHQESVRWPWANAPTTF